MKDTILVITEPSDLHADVVIAELDRRDVPVFRLHTEDLPSSVTIAIGVADGRCRGRLEKPGRAVDLERIGSAWYRRPGKSVPARITDPVAIDYVQLQCQKMLAALYATLDVTWVADPDKLRRAEVKAVQLVRAHAAGLTVPPTLFANAVQECQDFRDAIAPQPCAVKPLELRPASDGNTRRVPLTTALPADAPLAGAELAPSIFQPYVEKELELRCVVIGDQVFAAAVRSQDDPRTRHDWRGSGDTRWEPYELPAAVADRLRVLVRDLELNFGSIDMILTPEGEHVFIDLNPNGQWLWLELETGAPLTVAVADLLCSGLEPARVAA